MYEFIKCDICVKMAWNSLYSCICHVFILSYSIVSGTGSSCERPTPIENADLKPEYDSQIEFDHGAKVEYDCKIGYSIEGTSRARECKNGQWSEILFHCYRWSCERPTPIENADLKPKYDSQIEFDHGAKVEYDCKIGYSIEGTSRARKCKNGQWSEILFQCYRSSCERPTPIENADLKPEYDSQIEFDHGAKVEYDCKIGYSIEGTSRARECKNGQWSEILFQCYRSSCERPTPIENADLKPKYDSQIEFDHGAKVEYDCKIGYSIEGTSRARKCKNGQWSEILFQCYRSSCERPTPVENADLKPEYDSQIEFDHGAIVEYDCSIGYSIEGTSRARECKNGQWSEILFHCYQITCSYVDSPEHGKRLDARNVVGEYTYFECDTGYKLIGPEKLWCRANGEWLPRYPPTCKAILCPELPSIRDGRTFQDSSDGMRNDYQSVTKYTCSSGYMLEGNNGHDSRECQSDGTWSGEQPTCTIPKCKIIETFYGGEIYYFGERERWSFVFYRCKDGYHLSPSNVQGSECSSVLEWDPVPPQCLKMARVEITENGYITGDQDILLHGESYFLKCHNGYELYSEEFGYTDQGLAQITNNNGTLEPKVLKCEEKRCDPTDQYKAIVSYTNGSSVTSKVLSQTTIKLECEQGYDYYRNDQPMERPFITKCVKGKFVSAPDCEEGRCNPTDLNKAIVSYTNGSSVTSKVLSQTTIKLECVQGYDYYRNDQPMERPFITKCVKGKFVSAPDCEEVRCDPTDLNKAIVSYTNGSSVTSKILSQTTIKLECVQGYDYYRNDQPMKRPFITKCVKGKFVSAPDCEEGRCDPADLNKAIVSYTNGSSVTSKVLSQTTIKLECVQGYDYYRNDQPMERPFITKCVKGKFVTAPDCEEGRCDPSDLYKGIVSYTNGSSVTSKILSQTTVKLECEQGYDYYRNDQPMERPFITNCVKGKFVSAPDCEEARCIVPGHLRNKDTYFRGYRTNDLLPEGHYMRAESTLEIVCATDFELYVNSTAKYLTSFTSVCRYGRFDNNTEEFPICLEKRCLFKPSQYACYTTNEKKECIRSEFKVPSRTAVTIKCLDGYTLNRSKDWLSDKADEEVQITCIKGAYFEGNSCIPESRCKLEISEGSKYYLNSDLIENASWIAHGTEVNMQCLENFDIFDAKDNIVHDPNRYPNVTCFQGNWENMYECKKRCDTFDITNGKIVNNGNNNNAEQAFIHGNTILVRCEGYPINDFQMKCVNGEWHGYINCKIGQMTTSVDPLSSNVTLAYMTGTTEAKNIKIPNEQTRTLNIVLIAVALSSIGVSAVLVVVVIVLLKKRSESCGRTQDNMRTANATEVDFNKVSRSHVYENEGSHEMSSNPSQLYETLRREDEDTSAYSVLSHVAEKC